jgi:hypothetical protein
VIPERSANAAIAEIADVEEIVSNVSEVVGDHHYKVIEARWTQDGSDFRTFYKMAESGRGLLKLEIKVLADAPEELIAGADMMAASFELK